MNTVVFDAVKRTEELMCRGSGNVYLAVLDGNFVKIGFTAAEDVRVRIRYLQTAHPRDIRLRLRIPASRELERCLHWLFAKRRVRREWFRYKGDIADYCAAMDNVMPPLENLPVAPPPEPILSPGDTDIALPKADSTEDALDTVSGLGRLLTEVEASRILPLSLAWFRKCRRVHTGPPYVKIGRCVLYPEAGLYAWIQARAVTDGRTEEEDTQQ